MPIYQISDWLHQTTPSWPLIFFDPFFLMHYLKREASKVISPQKWGYIFLALWRRGKWTLPSLYKFSKGLVLLPNGLKGLPELRFLIASTSQNEQRFYILLILFYLLYPTSLFIIIYIFECVYIQIYAIIHISKCVYIQIYTYK